jgi:hypothetical protein
MCFFFSKTEQEKWVLSEDWYWWEGGDIRKGWRR